MNSGRQHEDEPGEGHCKLIVIDAVVLPPGQDPHGPRIGRPAPSAEEIASLGISETVFVEFTDPPPAGR